MGTKSVWAFFLICRTLGASDGDTLPTELLHVDIGVRKVRAFCLNLGVTGMPDGGLTRRENCQENTFTSLECFTKQHKSTKNCST